MAKKNKFREIKPVVEEIKRLDLPAVNYRSIYIGKAAHAYGKYIMEAHLAFVNKFPMDPGHENTQEWKEFMNQNTPKDEK